MRDSIVIHVYGAEAIPLVETLWEALFDHHVSIGAAGLPTIPREASWPRRRKHYETVFADTSNTGLWIASLNGDAVAYAVAYEDALAGGRVMVLETLSVMSAARGHGLGTLIAAAA